MPIRAFRSEEANTLKDPVVLVVEESQLPVFFDILSRPAVLSTFNKVVKGAFITRGNKKSDRPTSFSPASTFPFKNFAPYPTGDYEWNPNGLDLLNRTSTFPPLYLLSVKESLDFTERLEWNKRRGYKFPQYVAKLNTEMWASKDANSF